MNDKKSSNKRPLNRILNQSKDNVLKQLKIDEIVGIISSPKPSDSDRNISNDLNNIINNSNTINIVSSCVFCTVCQRSISTLSINERNLHISKCLTNKNKENNNTSINTLIQSNKKISSNESVYIQDQLGNNISNTKTESTDTTNTVTNNLCCTVCKNSIIALSVNERNLHIIRCLSNKSKDINIVNNLIKTNNANESVNISNGKVDKVISNECINKPKVKKAVERENLIATYLNVDLSTKTNENVIENELMKLRKELLSIISKQNELRLKEKKIRASIKKYNRKLNNNSDQLYRLDEIRPLDKALSTLFPEINKFHKELDLNEISKEINNDISIWNASQQLSSFDDIYNKLRLIHAKHFILDSSYQESNILNQLVDNSSVNTISKDINSSNELVNEKGKFVDVIKLSNAESQYDKDYNNSTQLKSTYKSLFSQLIDVIDMSQSQQKFSNYENNKDIYEIEYKENNLMDWNVEIPMTQDC